MKNYGLLIFLIAIFAVGCDSVLDPILDFNQCMDDLEPAVEAYDAALTSFIEDPENREVCATLQTAATEYAGGLNVCLAKAGISEEERKNLEEIVSGVDDLGLNCGDL